MNGNPTKLLFLILCLVTNGVQATTKSPDMVVRETADGVIERIKEQREDLQAHPEKIYDLINELVIPNFDFISMSKWVLGKKNWKAVTEMQRNKFVEQFRALLVKTYARALLEYSDQEIKYYPVEQKPNSKLAVVKTELVGSGAQLLPVTYRMYLKDEKWKVVDVTVDGVSLVSTYRGSFAAQIKKNGFDALIQELADKNEKLASNINK